MENSQALGYMLAACGHLGYSKEEARKLKNEMMFQFDAKTPEEAEKRGFKWYHDEAE